MDPCGARISPASLRRARKSSSFTLANAIAYVEWQSMKPKGIIALFEKAAQEGSRLAHVNIALVHLQGGRVEQATAALRRANELGAFDRDPELKARVSKVIEP